MKLFVTGFGPFLEHAENPSAALAANSGLDHAVLEVSYAAAEEFFSSWDHNAYDGILMIGLAAKRVCLSLETTGRNRKGSTRDLRGEVEPGVIEAEGPEFRRSTLWEGLSLSDPRLLPSEDAGDYLCNYVLYRALGLYANLPVGFLHIPPISAIPIEQQQTLLTALIDDIRVANCSKIS